MALPWLCDDGHAWDGGHYDVAVAFGFDGAVNGDTVPNSNHRALGLDAFRDAFDAADVLMSTHFDDFLPHFYCTQIVCNAFGHIL